MKIFYEDQKKNFMDKHNQSIRRLQMQHEEYLKSNGIPLNRDDWLKASLKYCISILFYKNSNCCIFFSFQEFGCKRAVERTQDNYGSGE